MPSPTRVRIQVLQLHAKLPPKSFKLAKATLEVKVEGTDQPTWTKSGEFAMNSFGRRAVNLPSTFTHEMDVPSDDEVTVSITCTLADKKGTTQREDEFGWTMPCAKCSTDFMHDKGDNCVVLWVLDVIADDEYDREQQDTAPVGREHPSNPKHQTITLVKSPEIVECKWAKDEVYPVMNAGWPPKQAPYDDIPERCKAALLVRTKDVPDNTPVKITVHPCYWNKKQELEALKDPEKLLDDLKVVGNRVVKGDTKHAPVWWFDARNKLWWPDWKTPFYYFKVSIEGQKLKDQTPNEVYIGRTAECLRLLYNHVGIADLIAETNCGGSLRITRDAALWHKTCSKGIKDQFSPLATLMESHKAYVHHFNQFKVLLEHWGSLVRNTYAYYQTSHGTGPDQKVSKFFGKDFSKTFTGGSAIMFGSTWPGKGHWNCLYRAGTKITASSVGQQNKVPSVPRFLAYLNCCLTAAEPSLVSSFINRGTKWVIGFEIPIGDTIARRTMKVFYDNWRDTGYDPEEVKNVFRKTFSTRRLMTDMKPKLYKGR